MANGNYRVARDTRREIGPDVLVVTDLGLYFVHPGFIDPTHEKIFEGNIKTCFTLKYILGNCFVTDQSGIPIVDVDG